VKKVLVTGAGGFIGGHLVNRLMSDGRDVIAVDVKPRGDWWQVNERAVTLAMQDCGDLFEMPSILQDVDDVYHLAENMGGIGFIETHRVDCLSSVVASVNLLNMLTPGQHRVFFSSSACAYNVTLQHNKTSVTSLREDMAWPAMPEAGYGLQKLYVEELCKWHHLERGLDVRVARFHNSYGAHGSWRDGREKAPAALMRKVAECVENLYEEEGSPPLYVWGDGTQLRSFMHVYDNITGIVRWMDEGDEHPINIGSSEVVTVNELIDAVELVAFGESGVLRRVYQPDKPKGVGARNSDNTRIIKLLNWEPSITLIKCVSMTYPWIEGEVK